MPTFKQITKFERGVTLNGESNGEYLVKNWHPCTTVSGLGEVGVYHSLANNWYTFGVTSNITNISYSIDGVNWAARAAISNFQVGSALMNPSAIGASFLMIGGGLSTGTVNKIRTSNDLGVSWSNVQIGATDNTTVSSIVHTTNGYNAKIFTAIYYSATGATGTWTNVQTESNVSDPDSIVASSSGLLVSYCNTGNIYFTSSNGSSWTGRTFPNSFVAKSITHGSVNGVIAFYALGIDTTGLSIYTSTSSTTWTKLIDLNAISYMSGGTPGDIAVSNNTLIMRIVSNGRADIWYTSPLYSDFIYPATIFGGALAPRIVTASRLGTYNVHQIGLFSDSAIQMSLVG